MNSGVFMHISADGVRKLGVDLTLLYVGNLRSIKGLLKARKCVKQLSGKYDLIHAQYGSACAVVTAAATGIPKVLSVRGSDWTIRRETNIFPFLHTRLARLMTRIVINQYNAVFPVSNRIASEIKSLYPNCPLTVMPSPINLTHFVPYDKIKARAALGYPDNQEKWVLFTSVKTSNGLKRYALAKDAFDRANARIGNLRMRVATDIPHSDMPLFVAACDLILCTSEKEGWPNSIKEALACNVPFISTDVSDLAEIAKQEEICRICPPDPAIIANNIIDVLSSPDHEPDLRRHVLEMDLSSTSNKIVNTYKQMLENFNAHH